MRKPNKYRAVPTHVNGIRFASKAEARRYGELRLLERAGKIKDLVCQHRIRCLVNDLQVCDYVADFTYRDERGMARIEDVKGVQTPVFRLKKKLVEALHPGLTIELVR